MEIRYPGGVVRNPTRVQDLFGEAAHDRAGVERNFFQPADYADAPSSLTLVEGDHVRVGTEDYPFDHSGAPAPTHELVAEVVQLAEAIGRPVATPEQAREIVGLPATAERTPVG